MTGWTKIPMAATSEVHCNSTHISRYCAIANICPPWQFPPKTASFCPRDGGWRANTKHATSTIKVTREPGPSLVGVFSPDGRGVGKDQLMNIALSWFE